MRSAGYRTRLNLALAMLFALFALACAASSASAESWGELKSFPVETGSGLGKLDEDTLVKFVAASSGTYYVMTEAPATHELVLQRYVAGAAQGKAILKGEKDVKGGVEGDNAILAVNPSGSRVYVLLVYERPGPTEREEEKEEFPLDSEMPAAGSLYAFEYEPKKEELVKKGELTRKELKGEGEHPKEALLDPRGMAVEPETGDLAISGNQDEESEANVAKGAEKQCRAAAQFVTVKSVESGGKAGEIESLSLGARYVDSAGKVLFGHTGCGGAEEEEEGIDQAPASPVFAPDGSLLGYGEDESVGPEGVIWQIAPSEADKHAPGEVKLTELATPLPKELFVAESLPSFAPNTGTEEQPDSVMSLVPDESSTDGTIYLRGDGADGEPAPAVLHYSHPIDGEPSITEIGWTAGGIINAEGGPGKCDLHYTEKEPLMLGGLLSGSKRGFLALTFYKEYKGPDKEVEVKRAEVVEFGEGGSTEGCPTVAVATPTQSHDGAPTNEVPASKEPLEVTSALGNLDAPVAGAKSVRWTVKFTPLGGGTREEKHYPATGETDYEYNGLHEEEIGYGVLLKVELPIAGAGTYEISNEVHTDDLADEVVKSGVDELTVTPGKLAVTPKTPSPSTVLAHEEVAKLAAEVEVPGEAKLHLKKVVWEFGDASPKVEETTPKELSQPAELSVNHAFSRCGAAKSTKCKIKLTVEVQTETPAKEEKLTKEFEITVKESKAEEAAEVPPTTTPTTTPTTPPTTTTTTTTTPQEPQGGVAGYIAAFSGSSLSVNAGGATSVAITCPSGGSCSGTLTLQTLGAVATSSKKHAAKRILTLASGAFSLSGGGKSVTLHLSSTARALLSRSHGVLRAKLTLLSRGTNGQKDSVTTHVVTLRLARKKK